MKELTEEQLSDNFNKLLEIIDTKIDPSKSAALKALYLDFEETVMFAPASGKESYHNCFIGGYIEHILNVINIGLATHKLWVAAGANIDYTESELVFALMNHDLGKIGLKNTPYYIPNQSEWHRKNQGIIFSHNPDLSYMTVPDRGLFLLQKYGIECTPNEYLAIKLHDGLYDDANKSYYMSWNDDGKLRTNLPHVVSQADFLASKVEYEKWKFSKNSGTTSKTTKIVSGTGDASKRVNALSSNSPAAGSKIFDSFFNKD